MNLTHIIPVTEIEPERILKIPFQMEFSTKTWKVTIKKRFNGKLYKSTIKLTKEGEIKSCDLNNIFTIVEYISMKNLKGRKMSDEDLERDLMKGFEESVHYIIDSLHMTEEQTGQTPSKFKADSMWIVVSDWFATVAIEMDIETFFEYNPASREVISEEAANNIKSIILSSAHGLVIIMGEDDEILSASISELKPEQTF